MSENAVLLFEVVGFLSKSLDVVWVPVDGVGATQIFDLGDAQLSIAHVLVQQTWLHFARVDVFLAGDNIMMHTRSVV
jgi:hypothetical protein